VEFARVPGPGRGALSDQQSTVDYR
jgi:hypothetical protein